MAPSSNWSGHSPFKAEMSGSSPVGAIRVCSKTVMQRSFKPQYAGSTPVIPTCARCARYNICPRRLKDRPGGHEPSDARSNRAGDTVTVADMVMQRIVAPPHAGSNPVSHLFI